MPSNCIIEFENNPSKVVYSGQLVRGNVRLTLTESKKVRSVYIKLKAKGFVRWYTGGGKSRQTHTGEEEYLHNQTNFIGNSDSSDDTNLLPGVYEYTFQCILPHQLPSSFEGEYGHIRYTASVVLNYHLWPDRKFKVPFTVIRPINLNGSPTLRNPVIAITNKEFNSYFLPFCCTTGPLRITCHLPIGGYVPGQAINLMLEISNKSNHSVSKFIVQLFQCIDYYARGGNSHRQREVIMAQGIAPGCQANNEVILPVNIPLTWTLPTDYASSTIIKIGYFIKVSGDVSFGHTNPKMKVPITIGTYPVLDESGVHSLVPVQDQPYQHSQ